MPLWTVPGFGIGKIHQREGRRVHFMALADSSLDSDREKGDSIHFTALAGSSLNLSREKGGKYTSRL